MLAEEPSDGVDADAVKMKEGEIMPTKMTSRITFFYPITQDASGNISFSFNNNALKSNKPSVKKIKTEILTETKGKNIQRKRILPFPKLTLI